MHFAHSRNLTSTLLIGGILLMALVLVQSKDPSSQDAPHIRHKRGIFWDFFQKMVITKNLIVDVSCYTETYIL